MHGEKGERECSFVYLPGLEGGKEIAEAIGVDYFSAPVEFAASNHCQMSRGSALMGTC